MKNTVMMEISVVKEISIKNNIVDLLLYSPNIAKSAYCGQIVNIKCESLTLRRPISICDCDIKSGILRLCFEIKGKGTDILSKSKIGDNIDLLGPLGKGYDINLLGKSPLLCGGGIGTFPLYFVAKSLLNIDIKVNVALAFRTSSLINMKEDFEKIGCKVHVSTDDGSQGFHGFAANLCENLFLQNDFSSLSICGPLMMMKTCAPIAIDRNIPCFASLEERMGCGIGACLACVCDIKDETEQGFHRERVCVEGPVFDASTVKWREI